MKHLRHFAIATRKDGVIQHFSGPHPTSGAAQTHLSTVLEKDVADGVEFLSAGIFAADFEATPIPAPAVKADSKEAS